MADNQFSVAVPNALQALMAGEQGYKDVRGFISQRDQEAARRDAQQSLLQGDTRGALARLIGANDPKNAAVLSGYENASIGHNSVYGTPIYGTRADGSTAIGTFDKRGQFREIQTPGFSPTPGIKTVDTGTGTVVIDSRSGRPVGGGAPSQQPVLPPGGQPSPGMPTSPQAQPQSPAGYIPKDVVGEARDKKYGTEQGDAKATLASLRAKLPGLKKVVTELGVIADKATYTTAGQMFDTVIKETGFNPREAAVARTRYISMVDNQVLPMLRDTFGAAFTVKEGETLRATLGDANKTPQEKKAVLDSFIEQKIRDISALEVQTGNQTSHPGSISPPRIGEMRDGYRFKGGNPADESSWVKAR